MDCRKLSAVIIAGCLAGAAPAAAPRAYQDRQSGRGIVELPATVIVTPTSEWSDTGISVHKGDRLVFTATGDVYWQARSHAIGPDGDHGVPGWSVGPGGLRARVGSNGHPFDLGARTTALQPPKHARPPKAPYVPPPVTMPADGSLFLGFKQFMDGANTGRFDVTIRPFVAPPATHGS
jgi:hypothetical protein